MQALGPRMQHAEALLLLLQCLLQTWFDADSGDTGSVPTTAERFDQQDRGYQALSLDLRGEPFIVQDQFLRRDHIQISDQSSGVARVRQCQRLSGIDNGTLLRVRRRSQRV